MKALISSIFILGLCFFLLVNCAPVNTGQKAPDFLASTMNWENFALKDFVGQQGGNKVLILAFFNTDCKPCGEALRYLQRLYDQYGRDGLDVVCVFTGHSAKTRDRAKRFIQNLDLKLTVVLDENGKIAKGYNVTGIPC